LLERTSIRTPALYRETIDAIEEPGKYFDLEHLRFGHEEHASRCCYADRYGIKITSMIRDQKNCTMSRYALGTTDIQSPHHPDENIASSLQEGISVMFCWELLISV
jgi:hypothetical protein